MSNGNVGLYPTADHWCFGRCYLQSWSTCHILTAVFLRFTRNMTIEIGSLEIWLLAVGHCPRPQTKAEDFKCQLLMHCTLRIYIMNCNLQWWGTQFFFSHALFLWDFFHSIFFFFVDVSVQVMVQISHLLSFIENDKRNQQQLQMYS